MGGLYNGKPNATVHSHPGIKAAVDEETFSMGYGAPYRETDWNNVRIDVKQAREKLEKAMCISRILVDCIMLDIIMQFILKK